MRFRHGLASIAASTLLLAVDARQSFGADSAKGEPAVDPGALYQRHCSACHGEKGDGNSRAQATLSKKPRNFTAEESRLRLTREYMIAIVRDGRPHTPMVARSSRLSQDEIEAVVDFIRTRFMFPDRQNAPAKGS